MAYGCIWQCRRDVLFCQEDLGGSTVWDGIGFQLTSGTLLPASRRGFVQAARSPEAAITPSKPARHGGRSNWPVRMPRRLGNPCRDSGRTPGEVRSDLLAARRGRRRDDQRRRRRDGRFKLGRPTPASLANDAAMRDLHISAVSQKHARRPHIRHRESRSQPRSSNRVRPPRRDAESRREGDRRTVTSLGGPGCLSSSRSADLSASSSREICSVSLRNIQLQFRAPIADRAVRDVQQLRPDRSTCVDSGQPST